MSKPHHTLTLRERRQLTKDILRAIAEDGAVFSPNSPAAKRLIKKYDKLDGDYQGVSRVSDALVDGGLLTPAIDSDGKRVIGRVRGITTKGLEELDRLEHPARTYFEQHLSKWLQLGLTAIIALATAITAGKLLS